MTTPPSIHDRGKCKMLFACPGEIDKAFGLATLMHWTGASIDDIVVAHLPLPNMNFSEFKALFFLSYLDGSVPMRIHSYASYFFDRDGAEALVFEFNRFSHRYISRSRATVHLQVSPI